MGAPRLLSQPCSEMWLRFQGTERDGETESVPLDRATESLSKRQARDRKGGVRYEARSLDSRDWQMALTNRVYGVYVAGVGGRRERFGRKVTRAAFKL